MRRLGNKTRERLCVTLTGECLGMIEEVAQTRGGSFRSHLIEEAVREWYLRVQQAQGNAPDPEPEPVRRRGKRVVDDTQRTRRGGRVKRRRVRSDGEA